MTEPTAIELFNDALEIESDQSREQFLDQACPNASVRRRVKALLAAHLGAGDFLQGDGAGRAMTEAVGPGTSNGSTVIGSMIGPYKIREQIGEGGMGAVYVAEQNEPVKRRVALKLIRTGLASSDVVGRFDAERQALAMMTHPNIARVLDGGTTESGQPYFAMELVQGLPITEYCDERRLTTEERLVLFLDVCGAVQHAHQRGIIHRDLKPSNILVAEIDDKAIVKVIDFGVAKAVNQKLTDQTVYTQFAQMVGTPLYMSPEQAGLGVLDIDTRSDVYSLGVLLYELLTGETPFDSKTLKSAGYDEMRRIIREAEPRRPSAMISTLNAEALSTLSQRRRTEQRQLAQALRGELDWIVMKTLEKDRSRRYQSAREVAEDVRRFLDGDAVQACPPSLAYRLQKSFRRNRTAMVTTGLVAAAMVVGTMVSVWQAVRATQQSQLVEQQRTIAAANFEKSLEAVDTLLQEVASETLVSTPQLTEVRRKLYDDAIRFYDELAESGNGDERVLIARASTRIEAAWLCGDQGDFATGLDYTFDAEKTLSALRGVAPDSDPIRRLLAKCFLARAYIHLGQRADSLPMHQRALELLASDEGSPVWAFATLEYACGLYRQRQDAAAIPHLERALDIYSKLYRDEPRYWKDLANAQRVRSRIFIRQSKWPKALNAAEEMSKIAGHAVAQGRDLSVSVHCLRMSFFNRGQAYEGLGKHEEALLDYEEALDISARLHTQFPAVADPWIDDAAAAGIARSLIRLERRDELQQRAEAMRPRSHADFIVRARLQKALGNGEESLSDLQHAFDLNSHWPSAAAQLADHYYAAGDYHAAATYLRATALARAHYWKRLGHAELANENYQRAIEAFRRGIESTPLSDNTLGWIPFLDLSNCADSEFRRAYLALHDELIESSDSHPRAYTFRSRTRIAFGEVQAGLEDIRQAMQFADDDETRSIGGFGNDLAWQCAEPN